MSPCESFFSSRNSRKRSPIIIRASFRFKIAKSGDAPTEYRCSHSYPRNTHRTWPREMSPVPSRSGLTPFGKAHGYTQDSAHDLRFPRIGKASYLAFGIRMRNRGQVTLAHFAPAANILSPELYKIDWPLMFVLPFDRRDPSLILIDLHNRTGPDDRVHREVGDSNQAVHPI